MTLPTVMESAWGDKPIVTVSLTCLETDVMHLNLAMTMKGQEDHGATALVSVLMQSGLKCQTTQTEVESWDHRILATPEQGSKQTRSPQT